MRASRRAWAWRCTWSGLGLGLGLGLGSGLGLGLWLGLGSELGLGSGLGLGLGLGAVHAAQAVDMLRQDIAPKMLGEVARNWLGLGSGSGFKARADARLRALRVDRGVPAATRVDMQHEDIERQLAKPLAGARAHGLHGAPVGAVRPPERAHKAAHHRGREEPKVAERKAVHPSRLGRAVPRLAPEAPDGSRTQPLRHLRHQACGGNARLRAADRPRVRAPKRTHLGLEVDAPHEQALRVEHEHVALRHAHRAERLLARLKHEFVKAEAGAIGGEQIERTLLPLGEQAVPASARLLQRGDSHPPVERAVLLEHARQLRLFVAAAHDEQCQDALHAPHISLGRPQEVNHLPKVQWVRRDDDCNLARDVRRKLQP
eukprot:scaffold99091_cov88-Phaeocystis_antarctica.AAC.3